MRRLRNRRKVPAGRDHKLVAAACLAAALLGPGQAVHAQAPAVVESSDENERMAKTEATREVAAAFLNLLFLQRDIRRAYDRFAAEDMIQHNPHMADGLAGHRAYFAELERRAGASADWANVNNILLVDGDLFALHHHVFTGPNDPGRVFVDIWRVAGGKIVEHWDVIQPIPSDMAHGNGVGCGKGDNYAQAKLLHDTITQPACGLPERAASRASSLATLDAYSKALFAGDVADAVDRFLTDDYRQHSPLIADGKAGAVAFLRDEFGKGSEAMPKMGPIRTIAEGDYVLMHRLTTYADGTQTANIDIFRTREGQISEHWDLKQEIADNPVNRNGMW